MQHPDVFHNGFCCPHESHAGEVAAQLKPQKWKDGGSERDMPRKIYGRDGVVLLSVSRVHVCPQGNEITAHDSRILVHLPTDKNNPFILSHKSGVTMGFMNEVNSLARSGMHVSEIEKHFAQHYYDKHWLQEKKWHDNLKSVKEKTSTGSSTIEDSTQDHFPDPAEWVELPSDDTIISCFVLNRLSRSDFPFGHFHCDSVNPRLFDTKCLYYMSASVSVTVTVSVEGFGIQCIII